MKLKHYDDDGRVRFITFCTHKNIPVLTNNKFREIVCNSIKKNRLLFGFSLFAYVIMPEHVHLVILPAPKMNVGEVIGEIKKISAKEIHKYLPSNGSDLERALTVKRNKSERFALWQRRCYDHNCRTDKSVNQKIEYCHYNPVRRGLVKRPENWKWSSYRWYQGYSDVPIEIDLIPV